MNIFQKRFQLYLTAEKSKGNYMVLWDAFFRQYIERGFADDWHVLNKELVYDKPVDVGT